MRRDVEVRDAVLAVWTRGAAVLLGSFVLFMAAFLVIGAWPALAEVGVARWVTDDAWRPSAKTSPSYCLLPAIVGSLATTLTATIVALPLGVGAALAAAFVVRPTLGRITNLLASVLAGLPSVVIGLWGLTCIVPVVAKIRLPGASLLAAALTLSVMIAPTIYVTTKAAIATVPRAQLDAALAMGLSRWGVLRAAVLPVVVPAVPLATLLAVVRALGETMAVVMVAGNVAAVPTSLFDPVRTLTANIALELPYATGLHRAALFASATLLLAIVSCLVLAATQLSYRNGASRASA